MTINKVQKYHEMMLLDIKNKWAVTKKIVIQRIDNKDIFYHMLFKLLYVCENERDFSNFFIELHANVSSFNCKRMKYALVMPSLQRSLFFLSRLYRYSKKEKVFFAPFIISFIASIM